MQNRLQELRKDWGIRQEGLADAPGTGGVRCDAAMGLCRGGVGVHGVWERCCG